MRLAESLETDAASYIRSLSGSVFQTLEGETRTPSGRRRASSCEAPDRLRQAQVRPLQNPAKKQNMPLQLATVTTLCGKLRIYSVCRSFQFSFRSIPTDFHVLRGVMPASPKGGLRPALLATVVTFIELYVSTEDFIHSSGIFTKRPSILPQVAFEQLACESA